MSFKLISILQWAKNLEASFGAKALRDCEKPTYSLWSMAFPEIEVIP